MDQRIIDLLPWYANGTLSESERAEVERSLSEDPAYRHELDLCHEIRNALRTAKVPIPSTLNSDALLARLDNNGQGSTLPVAPDESLAGRVKREFLRLFASGFGLQLAGLAVMVVQSVVIGYMLMEPSAPVSEIRSPAVDTQYVGPFVKVSFSSDAKEADIRLLLVGLGASIISGPSQLGDYILYVGATRTDFTVEQLKKSALVESATVIAAFPATKD